MFLEELNTALFCFWALAFSRHPLDFNLLQFQFVACFSADSCNVLKTILYVFIELIMINAE